MGAALPADRPRVRRLVARLADPRIQAEIADELARSPEPGDVADRGEDAHGDRGVHARDCRQVGRCRVRPGESGELGIGRVQPGLERLD